MNRRDFLKRFSAAAAVGTAAIVAGVDFDPEKLLWVPGAKTFFLPPEKKVVMDIALVLGEYEALVTVGATDMRAVREILQGAVAHRVQTAMGLVESDAAWNVIKIAGRRVSAYEAAKARVNHYQPCGLKSAGEMVNQVIAERLAAGWADPIGDVVEHVHTWPARGRVTTD